MIVFKDKGMCKLTFFRLGNLNNKRRSTEGSSGDKRNYKIEKKIPDISPYR